MKKLLTTSFILILCQFSHQLRAQEEVFQTFKDTRIINSQSTETIKAGYLDFRVGHRFGDFAGDAGGWQTFYGLENASDIMIGFEYGLSDKVNIGINRTKGSGPLKQNVNGLMKIKFVNQQINSNQPLSIVYYGMASYSTMQKSATEGVLNYFAKPEHRLSYHMELIFARKFSDYFSFQLSGAWTYRNIVPSLDDNTIVSLAGALRLQMTKSLGILLEGRIPFSRYRTPETGYYLPLGVALEWETGGGHVFQLNFTNVRGMAETDFIPYSTSDWGKGEFRMGFTISRLFNLW